MQSTCWNTPINQTIESFLLILPTSILNRFYLSNYIPLHTYTRSNNNIFQLNIHISHGKGQYIKKYIEYKEIAMTISYLIQLRLWLCERSIFFYCRFCFYFDWNLFWSNKYWTNAISVTWIIMTFLCDA